jgi:hypothetical protein
MRRISVSCKNIRLSADVPNPLTRSRNSWADGDGGKGVTGFPVSAACGKALRSPNRTHAPSSLQNIRLSSDVPNPLNGSRN